MTQGGLVSPTLFNIVVENLIPTLLAMTVDDHRVAHNRMVEAIGRSLGVFYANVGIVGSIDSEWLQHLTNFLAGLFRRYGLAANVPKSRMMTCQPGALRSDISEESNAMK